MVFKHFLSKAKDIDILSSIPDGIILIDSSGKIEWINDVVPILFRMNRNDILKLNFNEIIDGGLDLVKQSSDVIKAVVGKVKDSAGKDLYMEITAKNIENYFVIDMRDVTQNYKTVTSIMVEHESSKKVNKDKNAFLVKLSNEIKSPINSIIGFSQAMIDGLGGAMSSKQEKYVKIINKNSNEALYFIDKIIELSQTESNLIDYDFQIFDVVNSVNNVLKNFEQTVKSKNLTLNINSDEVSKRTIFSDEGIFKVVMQNILETSLNYTDVGSINIKISHPDMDLVSQQALETGENITEKSYIMIVVSDTGAGISTSDMNVIFDPYAQLDRANKKNIVRSIALASAKNLVRYLRGAIWMESAPMQGSTYNVILPVEKFI